MWREQRAIHVDGDKANRRMHSVSVREQAYGKGNREWPMRSRKTGVMNCAAGNHRTEVFE